MEWSVTHYVHCMGLWSQFRIPVSKSDFPPNREKKKISTRTDHTKPTQRSFNWHGTELQFTMLMKNNGRMKPTWLPISPVDMVASNKKELSSVGGVGSCKRQIAGQPKAEGSIRQKSHNGMLVLQPRRTETSNNQIQLSGLLTLNSCNKR